MARDNSPRERQRAQLERKVNRRASYDRILIVCEGRKTEPNYFNEIRAVHRLQTANVEVRHSELGTAPLQVVRYAQELFEHGDRHRHILRRAFERVYAVFDRDDHHSYFDALNYAAQLDGKLRNDAKQAVTFKAIASVPNFELWLLLHFEDIRAPLHRDEVLRRLRTHLPGYQKGNGSVFADTRAHLDIATHRAQSLANRFTAEDGQEPFTAVVDMVMLLTTLKDRTTP